MIDSIIMRHKLADKRSITDLDAEDIKKVTKGMSLIREKESAKQTPEQICREFESLFRIHGLSNVTCCFSL
jgi:hypothetical protein